MEENRFWKNIKYFGYQEFSAPEDPDSGLGMDHYLVMSLDELRGLFGYPIIIHENGAFSVKGHTENSYHYEGKAVDFHVDPKCKLPSRQQGQIIFSTGKFRGIGFYPEWKPVPGWHLDVRPGFQVWKKTRGEYVYLF